MPRRASVLAVIAAAALAAAPAFAQGNAPRVPPGQTKRTQQVPSTSGLVADSVEGSATRVRTLGAWLDDATPLAPGETWLAVSVSTWRMPIATGGDAPMLDLSAGFSPRVQVSLALPYGRVSDGAGYSTRGFGDLYVATKIVLRDPGRHALGVSVTPTLEYLSDTSRLGTGLERTNWILPVSLERRLTVGRMYGSAGYFTRGVLFASGAYERPLTDALALSAAVTHSLATDEEALSEEIGLGRRRMDVSGTLAYSVSPRLAIFGSLGRTVWGLDDDSTSVLATAGLSMKVAAPRPTPP